MFISKLWVEIFWCILFGVTGVMFLWGMVTDACRWTATPVCRGTLTTVKGLKWVKVTIEVWSFASKVRKVGGDLQNLHIWGNLCEFWIWIWRKGFFDNGIVREWRKNVGSVQLQLMSQKTKFSSCLPYNSQRRLCFSLGYLTECSVEACLNQEERLAFNWTTETVPACSSPT